MSHASPYHRTHGSTKCSYASKIGYWARQNIVRVQGIHEPGNCYQAGKSFFRAFNYILSYTGCLVEQFTDQLGRFCSRSAEECLSVNLCMRTLLRGLQSFSHFIAVYVI